MPPDLADFPEAMAVPRRRLPQLVWVVPLIAVFIGGWLLLNILSQHGPTVVISFLSAEGIEPGKTRIRFKDVDIGEVKKAVLADDRSHVLVTAQLVKNGETFLATDTRFWVVRPRVAGGRISGIGTVLSGAYIGVDVGSAEETSREFVGLEVAPILTRGLPGRHFTLHAKDVGSLDIGSPLYFRRIQVGEVVAYDLDKNGGNVTVKVFIHAPYDRYVTLRTRFWNASGVDISLDANGVRLQSQSLVSVLLGGIAFETPDNDSKAEAAPPNATFTLHPDRSLAIKAPDGTPLILTLHFEESIRGLVPGAPVDFRGIVVGEVLSVGIEYEQKRDWFHFPVRIALYSERIDLRVVGKESDPAASIKQGLLKAMNERGFRAQLRTGNLLTGQSYIALDFFPDLPKKNISWYRPPLEMPTVRGNLEEFQVSLARILAKLDKVPLDEIGKDLRNVLKTLDHSVNSIDNLAQRLDSQTAPEIASGIKELRATLTTLDRLLASDSPLQQDTREALREIGKAAEAFRTLADTIERQPQALLWGKKEPK